MTKYRLEFYNTNTNEYKAYLTFDEAHQALDLVCRYFDISDQHLSEMVDQIADEGQAFIYPELAGKARAMGYNDCPAAIIITNA